MQRNALGFWIEPWLLPHPGTGEVHAMKREAILHAYFHIWQDTPYHWGILKGENSMLPLKSAAKITFFATDKIQE